MNLKELKTTDFDINNKYDFIFALGAIEQHGPFLPLGTDSYIVDHIIDEVIKLYPDLIKVPTLPYSRSFEHRGFPGTIWLTENTLYNVLFDVCTSIHSYSSNILFVSFHENEPYILNFIDKYKDTFNNLHYVDIFSEEDDDYIRKNILGGEIDGHAGNSEISNILYLNDELVTKPDANYPKVFLDNPFATDNIIDFSKDGIADNNPKWQYSKEEGKLIFDLYIKRTIENLKKII